MAGQYNNPVAVVAFNVAEQWASDVSVGNAMEIRRRADLDDDDLLPTIADFVDRHACRERKLTLRLA